MNQNQIPKVCPYCRSPIKKIPAGVSKKTGKPYQEFYACENFDCKYTWRPNSNTTSRQQTKTVDGNAMMIDELENITKGLRAIYKLLEERLPNEEREV